jgi:hypothetical protein
MEDEIYEIDLDEYEFYECVKTKQNDNKQPKTLEQTTSVHALPINRLIVETQDPVQSS